MARGRRTSLTIRLTPAEQETLLAWQRSTTIPAGMARRGRIILLMADRVPISHIAATVGISRRFIYTWVQRFLHDGLQGLEEQGWIVIDRTRGGKAASLYLTPTGRQRASEITRKL